MPVLLLGDGGPLARACAEALSGADGDVPVVLDSPSDEAVRETLVGGFDAVAIVTRDDVLALRLALVVEAVRPGIRLVVTIFDRTVAQRLSAAVPSCRVLSFAEVAAPDLADQCLEAGTQTRWGLGSALTEIFDRVRSALWPVPTEARILVVGLAGLVSIIVADIALLVAATDLGIVDAIYGSVRTLTTVQAEPAVSEGPSWLKLASAGGMLITLGFAALFTAGLIQWLLDPRLTSIVGRRVVPRRDHVIVVGMGQVGLRLCTYLRNRGVGVVAVELEPAASAIRFARSANIPVVLGHGEDRRLLERLFVQRARAVVAATAEDLVNIEIAITVGAVTAETPVVMRAREGILTRETMELFGLGIVRDVDALTARRIVSALQA